MAQSPAEKKFTSEAVSRWISQVNDALEGLIPDFVQESGNTYRSGRVYLSVVVEGKDRRVYLYTDHFKEALTSSAPTCVAVAVADVVRALRLRTGGEQ